MLETPDFCFRHTALVTGHPLELPEFEENVEIPAVLVVETSFTFVLRLLGPNWMTASYLCDQLVICVFVCTKDALQRNTMQRVRNTSRLQTTSCDARGRNSISSQSSINIHRTKNFVHRALLIFIIDTEYS